MAVKIEGAPQIDLENLENSIEKEKNPEKKAKLEAKLELANKMGKRRNQDSHQALQDIKIQERFDKHPISTRTDMIGDDNLSDKVGSFKKGGLVKSGKPKIAKKGWK